MAQLVSARSTCSRLKVGCILTDEAGELIWMGYNGGFSGGPNSCRHPEAEGGCGCVHAEINALIKADGSTGKIAYVTDSPCPLCAVALANAHVCEVHFSRQYRNTEGVQILEEAGIAVNPVDGYPVRAELDRTLRLR